MIHHIRLYRLFPFFALLLHIEYSHARLHRVSIAHCVDCPLYGTIACGKAQLLTDFFNCDVRFFINALRDFFIRSCQNRLPPSLAGSQGHNCRSSASVRPAGILSICSTNTPLLSPRRHGSLHSLVPVVPALHCVAYHHLLPLLYHICQLLALFLIGAIEYSISFDNHIMNCMTRYAETSDTTVSTLA